MKKVNDNETKETYWKIEGLQSMKALLRDGSLRRRGSLLIRVGLPRREAY